ncbi:MAG: hypothetical protein FJW88_03525 [Actinobacteria bacterium]|nr:hypothetical protein [Actinomycetota bacterium]
MSIHREYRLPEYPPLDELTMHFELTPIRCTVSFDGHIRIRCDSGVRHRVPTLRRFDITYDGVTKQQLDLVEGVICEDPEGAYVAGHWARNGSVSMLLLGRLL